MDSNWTVYLQWREEKGYKGLSTVEQNDEFLAEQGEQPLGGKLSRKELHETAELFEGVCVKDSVAETFQAIKTLMAVGSVLTYDDLAQLTGKSLRTVKDHVAILQEKGYLHIKRGVHANTYYVGNDMRDLRKKKSIHFVDTFEWTHGLEDVVGEVTIKDGLDEVHFTMYNAEGILERTSQFMREVDSPTHL